MDFGKTLRNGREAAGLTQAEIAATSGIARSNIAAYEAGRREPKISTATRLLAAIGVQLEPAPIVDWTWTSTRHPYPVPSRLWRLPAAQAFATISASAHIWWSGPPRHFDLADRTQRARAYEIYLREGTPDDIQATIDGVLLIDLFDELVLPSPLRRAWRPIVASELTPIPDIPAP